MDFTKYSKRQEQIISGEIPILQAGDIEVRRLFIKALNAFDKKVITFAEKELERRSVYITNSRQAYCEKQKDVIDGKVALEDLSQTDLIRFYARTKYQGDRQLGEKIAEELRRRGRWINKIEGYNARQTLIIRGEIDIHTVHDAAVRGLRNAAIAAGDMDVLEWVEEEYSRRNLENSEKELNHIYDLEYLVSRNLFDKMSDTDINYAVYLASKSNNEDALQRLSEEVIERSNHSRSQLYYEREIDIINGVTLLEETSRWVLTNLLEKLKIDDSCDRSELIENIERELQKRDLERTALVNAQKNEYTSNQKAVIEGEIPLYRESTEALKTILRKAERRGETEEVAEIKNEVEARSKKLEEGQPYSDLQQMLINSMRKVESERRESLLKYKVEAHEEEEYKRIVEEYKHERSKRPIPISAQVKDLRDDEYKECLEEYLRTRPYTNRQLEIMEGSIPLDKVKTKDLINLVNKARALNDDDYADYLTDYLKNRGNRNHNNVSGIIRGEIPYEEITIYQLKALAAKAKAVGNIELFELAQTLIIDKKNDQREAKRKNKFYRGATDYERQAPIKSNDWAMGILESDIDPTPYSMLDLQNIRLFASTLEDPVYEEIARYLINERQDRRFVRKATSREETRELIERNTMFPIEWPASWGKK